MATHGQLAVNKAMSNLGSFQICPKCGKPKDSPMIQMNCKCIKDEN